MFLGDMGVSQFIRVGHIATMRDSISFYRPSADLSPVSEIFAESSGFGKQKAGRYIPDVRLKSRIFLNLAAPCHIYSLIVDDPIE